MQKVDILYCVQSSSEKAQQPLPSLAVPCSVNISYLRDLQNDFTRFRSTLYKIGRSHNVGDGTKVHVKPSERAFEFHVR